MRSSPSVYVATGRVAGSCWTKGNCSLSAPLRHGRASELPARRGRFQDPQRALRRLPTCGGSLVSMAQAEVRGKKQIRGGLRTAAWVARVSPWPCGDIALLKQNPEGYSGIAPSVTSSLVNLGLPGA